MAVGWVLTGWGWYYWVPDRSTPIFSHPISFPSLSIGQEGLPPVAITIAAPVTKLIPSGCLHSLLTSVSRCIQNTGKFSDFPVGGGGGGHERNTGFDAIAAGNIIQFEFSVTFVFLPALAMNCVSFLPNIFAVRARSTCYWARRWGTTNCKNNEVRAFNELEFNFPQNG